MKVLIDQVSYAIAVENGAENVNGLLSTFQNRMESLCYTKLRIDSDV
jgi:hypothetical protein